MLDSVHSSDTDQAIPTPPGLCGHEHLLVSGQWMRDCLFPVIAVMNCTSLLTMCPTHLASNRRCTLPKQVAFQDKSPKKFPFPKVQSPHVAGVSREAGLRARACEILVGGSPLSLISRILSQLALFLE